MCLGFISGRQDRYFVLWSNGEFNYYLSDVVDEETPAHGSIHLPSIVGLQVCASVPGPERPGLLIKTDSFGSKREYFLAASEHTLMKDVESWVPAIMALREGRVPEVREEEVLLEFSMNSEEEPPEQHEVEGLLHSSGGATASNGPPVVQMPEILPSLPNMEDVRAIEALNRSWDSPSRRPMLERTLIRCVNYFVGHSTDRARHLVDLSDGVALVHLLRALGQPVDFDLDAGSKYDNQHKVATVTAAVNALKQVSDAVDISAGLVVSGNPRAVASVVWATLYLLFVKPLQFGGSSGVGAVVNFVQTSVASYPHVRITDLSHSFLDGFALNAIFDHWCPNVIDYETLQPHLALRNLERMFQKSNELLNVPLLLEASDFSSDSFDETSLVLYLGAFMQKAVAAHDKGKGEMNKSLF